MTCRTVPMSPSLCTCGVVLDITVFHGEDDIGNDLCPTCSGCGCEPNERNLMNERLTEAELDALPEDAIVLIEGDLMTPDQAQKLEALFARLEQLTQFGIYPGCTDDIRTALWLLRTPVPEPDHSMCARLVPNDDCAYGSDLRWALQSPSGEVLTQFRATDGGARRLGYAIPEPEPTVVERAAKVLADVDIL